MNNRRKTPLHLDRKGGDKIVRNRRRNRSKISVFNFKPGGVWPVQRGQTVCVQEEKRTEIQNLGPGVKWV